MNNFYKGLIFLVVWSIIILLLAYWESNNFEYCVINECCSTTGSLWQRVLWTLNPLFLIIGYGLGLLAIPKKEDK